MGMLKYISMDLRAVEVKTPEDQTNVNWCKGLLSSRKSQSKEKANFSMVMVSMSFLPRSWTLSLLLQPQVMWICHTTTPLQQMHPLFCDLMVCRRNYKIKIKKKKLQNSEYPSKRTCSWCPVSFILLSPTPLLIIPIYLVPKTSLLYIRKEPRILVNKNLSLSP